MEKKTIEENMTTTTATATTATKQNDPDKEEQIENNIPSSSSENGGDKDSASGGDKDSASKENPAEDEILTGKLKRNKRVHDSRFNMFFHTEFSGLSSLLTGKMSIGFGLSRSASNKKIKDEIELSGKTNEIKKILLCRPEMELCSYEQKAITANNTEHEPAMTIEEIE